MDLEKQILEPNLAREADEDELTRRSASDGESSDEGEVQIKQAPLRTKYHEGAPKVIKSALMQVSSRTGPKGVLADHRAMQREAAALAKENEIQRAEIMRRAAEGSTTTEPSISLSATAAARKAQLKDGASDGESDSDFSSDDEFLAQYRAQRIQELQAGAASTQPAAVSSARLFGRVIRVSSGFEMVDEINGTPATATCIVHLSDHSIPECAALDQQLPQLAAAHSSIKWVTCEASAADPDYDPIALPTLIQYKAGDTTDVLVQLRSPLGPRAPLTLDDTVDALKRQGWISDA